MCNVTSFLVDPRLGHLLNDQQQDNQQVVHIECIICNENFATVQFIPCSHQICCPECCVKMKKCIICQLPIEKKTVVTRCTSSGNNLSDLEYSLVSNNRKESKDNSDAILENRLQKETGLFQKILPGSEMSPSRKPLSAGTASGSADDRLQYLESKIAEIEEANNCGICMERVKNVVFLCGHGACVKCAQTLKTCHMCRETITKKINVY